MRVYWVLKGSAGSLYTAYKVDMVKDKQTEEIYYPEKIVALPKDQAPKTLAEQSDRYELFIKKEEFHMERRGLFGKQKVFTQISGAKGNPELTGLNGFWPIEGYSPLLYTRKACDLFRDKKTKQVYRRGKIQIFWSEDYPLPLAEHLNVFDFIYYIKDAPLTQEDYSREIWASHLFGKR